MTVLEAIEDRHAVRSYLDKAIPADVVELLQEEIDLCNREGGVHIQLVTGEKKAFDGMMAHYGKLFGVENYIALVGEKSAELEEKLGYYGERVVLKAQTLGLNTCWVALTFSKEVTKKHIIIGKGEKLGCVIAIGYGATQGIPHKSKPMEALYKAQGEKPDWFKAGMDAAILAPTAINQQSFRLSLTEKGVKAENLGGFYSDIDLGIVKYHFEIGAGRENFSWVD